MFYFWIAVAALDLLILFFLFLLTRISLRGMTNDIRRHELPPNSQLSRLQAAILSGEHFFDEHPAELLTIQFNGTHLAAKRFSHPNPIGRILLFHGYRSMAETDFACAMEIYHSFGYELILIDQRAHGRSGGNWIGFGVLEQKDCLAWIHYVNDKFGAIPTFLNGVSMGATTVLMALGNLMPQNVRGVIADCGFTSPKEIIRHVMKRKLFLPSPILLPILSLFSKIFAGYYFGEYSTVDALRKAAVPVLFIHGTEDRFVPPAMTLQNYEACVCEKELLLVEGAGHGTSYLQDQERVEKTIAAFLKKHNK